MREKHFKSKNVEKMYEKQILVDRDYVIVEFSFSDFSEADQEKIKQDAENLRLNANNKGANTGEERSAKVIENDAYAGILAEFATVYFLNSLNLGIANRPEVTDYSNQIDVLWNINDKGPKTVEVRSSFVRNGLEFALFSIDNKTDKTYFDIIGPYYQKNYKSDYEPFKNLYSRVLFEGNKYDIRNRFIEKDESFYLIGFLSARSLIELGYHKSLTEKDSTNLSAGDYYVAPINLIWDISEFKEIMKKSLRT